MKFDQWFKAQHGQLPMTTAERYQLLREMVEHEGEFKRCKAELDADALLGARYNDARAVWQMTDADKKGAKL